MTTTVQQLEDLKEWSQDSTRYERRLAFRGHMPSTEAGTIPVEFDELSDREREYYRTGPWSTREDYRKGQLVQPGPGRQGYKDGTSKKQLSFDFKAKKKPTTIGEATIDFIVEKGRQPKPSEVLQIKEKLKVNKSLSNKKTVPKFKPKISGGQAFHSFPASLPRMWKTLGSGARKALGWATGLGSEVVFFYWDKANEMSKGKTEEEAAGIAANNASFGIIPNKKYLPDLKKVAKDMGINPQAFEKVYFLNEQMAKVQKQDEQYQQRIELIKKMPGDPERKAEALAGMEEAYANWQKGMTSQIEKWSEDVAGQIAISKTKLPKPSLDQIAEERYNITDEDWMKPFIDIQNVSLEKLEREK